MVVQVHIILLMRIRPGKEEPMKRLNNNPKKTWVQNTQ